MIDAKLTYGSNSILLKMGYLYRTEALENPSSFIVAILCKIIIGAFGEYRMLYTK